MSLTADVRLHAAVLEQGEKAEHVVRTGRHAWIQVTTGRVRVDGVELGEGDGASTSEAGTLSFEGDDHAEVLVFDLP